MPAFKLGDQFGFSLDVVPDPQSGIAKYFQQAVDVVTHGFDLTRVAGLDLRDPAVTAFQTGLTFSQPIGIDTGDVPLSVQAGLNGSLGFFIPAAGGDVLFSPDDYGDNIPVPGAERYVSLGISASASIGATVSAGSVSFGFQPGTSFNIVNYCRFLLQPAPTLLTSALADTIRGFSLPRTVEDLTALPEGRLVTLTGAGVLNFTAAANLLAIVNPLATVALPGGTAALDVKAGESIDVTAGFSVSCEYQIRVRKVAPNRVRLGYYKKHGSETTVGASLSAGLTATIGGFDLYSTILGAVSGNPTKDMAALQNAGLSAGQIGAIEGAVKAGLARKLELALSAELGSLDSNQAAFLYEVDLGALDAQGRDTVHRALGGDLAGFVSAESTPTAGITPLRSITSSLRQRRHTLKINLLGIYNFISISNLTLSGRVVYDPVTGDLVITDTATADRIQTARASLAADPDHLRHVLAESFLITAAYRGSKSVAAAPELRSSHSFFEFSRQTGRQAMADHLEVATALGLLAPADVPALLGSLDDFGPTTICAETRYDDELTTALFLAGGQPRPPADYERAGRDALQSLVRPGEFDDYRQRPAVDDDLWVQMCSVGQPGFGSLFPDLRDQQVAVIAADYSVIVWWAETMRQTAGKLAALRALVDANPAIGWEDPRFHSLREDLQNHMRAVARDTKEEFGRPWGLIAMDRVSGCAAQASVQLTGGRVALLRDRLKAVAAAPGRAPSF